MTFADLMSLLMCFFVLLLAFSEMDALKFKQLAGSMKEAFGVQREIKAKAIPKGTSVIAREFSPGRPEPTLVQTVQQRTVENLQTNLRVTESPTPDTDPLATHKEVAPSEPESEGENEEENKQAGTEVPDADASDVEAALAEDIDAGMLEVDTEGQRIVIRIRERGSFPSGAAILMNDFQPVLARIGAVLSTTQGKIIIAGHTDDIPIATARFRSNWELAASRAVSVVEHLTRITDIAAERFMIESYAETVPLVANDSAEDRARNRRVEIVIVRGGEDVADSEVSTEVQEPGQ